MKDEGGRKGEQQLPTRPDGIRCHPLFFHFILHPSSLILALPPSSLLSPPAPQPAPPSVAASRGHGEVPPVEHRILRASPDRAARKRSTAARADSSRCLSPAWRQSNRSPCDSIHPKAWYPQDPPSRSVAKGPMRPTSHRQSAGHSIGAFL